MDPSSIEAKIAAAIAREPTIAQYTRFIAEFKDIELPSFLLPFKLLGKGTYAEVFEAVDASHPNFKKYALKKNKSIFRCTKFAQYILRELKLMLHLKHPNILGAHHVFRPVNQRTFDSLVIATEKLDTDLISLLSEGVPLTVAHVRAIMWQLLRALQYMHLHKAIHRDLAPKNVLVNPRACHIKICDFGLSRIMPAAQGMTDEPINKEEDETKDSPQTTFEVVSAEYRAPEVILKARYSFKIDTWSAGCILGELLQCVSWTKIPKRKLMFNAQLCPQLYPNHAHYQGPKLLDTIIEVCGTPSAETIANLKLEAKFEQELKAFPSKPRIDFSRLFLNRLSAEEEAKVDATELSNFKLGLDLLDKLLQFDPAVRLSAEDALRHPFFGGEEERQKPKNDINLVGRQDFSFDSDASLTNDAIRRMMLEIIEQLNRPPAPSSAAPSSAAPSSAASPMEQ